MAAGIVCLALGMTTGHATATLGPAEVVRAPTIVTTWTWNRRPVHWGSGGGRSGW
jgi:hypothetical protein